ncbi:hypothetical protein LCGC14_0769540 [marine sediment metagenome]|uniref:Uncharacterized protein n=1 Tax=marine sediment metagenome TaxID=412755 RepID=A0A0F9QIK2_9ZZZZ
MPWPYAVESLGFYPPETIVQIPMKIFERLIIEAPNDQRPNWWQDALDSGESFLVLQAKTFYQLLGSGCHEAPQYMLDHIEEERAME